MATKGYTNKYAKSDSDPRNIRFGQMKPELQRWADEECRKFPDLIRKICRDALVKRAEEQLKQINKGK